MAEWYYIGHYGQLGPLTRDQLDELIEGGVVERETYVWHKGLGDWRFAGDVAELADVMRAHLPNTPPPMPAPRLPAVTPPALTYAPVQALRHDPYPNPYANAYPVFGSLVSDKSRVLGGLLQVLPGIGRIYLGYAAHGVLQLILTPCMGIGWLWSLIDGMMILSGNLRLDGYGRRLKD